MAQVELKPLPFDEAIEFFNAKDYKLSPNSWRDVWAEEHVHAFTVARVTRVDILEDIRQEVQKALEQGTSLGKFKAALSEVLQRKGWLGREGIAPWRLQTIYRTNLQSAYQAGRYKQMLEVATTRPWWMYDAVNDSRTRPSHLAHDGVVRHFMHPFWDTWYPPNGFNCRCTVRALSDTEMKRRGIKEETAGTSLTPDEGFSYNPGLVRWQPDLEKYSPFAREALREAARPADMPALSARLTRIREGFRQTGIQASSPPIRLKRDRTTRDNGWAKYVTGEIGLRADIYDEIKAALGRGRVSSIRQMNAFKTLVHEMGHHIGAPVDINRYWSDMAYRACGQTINDIWARYALPSFLRSMGLRFDLSAALRVRRTHPTGYQIWVERLMSILRGAGMGDAEIYDLATELNFTVEPDEISKRLRDAVRQKAGDRITRDLDVGKALLQSDEYDRWMEILQRD